MRNLRVDMPHAPADDPAVTLAPMAQFRRENAGRLRALLLPPMAWQPERDAWRPGEAPDPFAFGRHLSALGIDAVLIDPGRRPLNPLAGRGTVLESLDPLRAIRVLLRERRADIAVSVFEGAALPLALLRKVAAFRVPLVLWDLGLTESWRLRECILDRVVPRVDAIFVLTASQRDYIARRWGRSQGVEFLGYCIDTVFFDRCGLSEPAAGPALGPVLAVGNDLGRDFATLLLAAPLIDADLVLKTTRVPAEAAPPRVKVLRERISPVALRLLYAQCRVLVVPLHATLNASGITTILEGAAMGCAMVVSDNPAIRDFLAPDDTCLVVPCGDAPAMARAVGRLLREPETRARLGQAARRFAERHCAPEVFAARLAALLRRYRRKGPTESTMSLDR